MQPDCGHNWIIGVRANSPPGTKLRRICGWCGQQDDRTLRLVSRQGDWTWVCPCSRPKCRQIRRDYYRQRFRAQPTPRLRQEANYEFRNKRRASPGKGTKKHGFLPDRS